MLLKFLRPLPRCSKTTFKVALFSSKADLTLREEILNAALKHVPEHGWSNESIALGAQNMGLPTMSHTMIERGPVELVEHFLEKKRQHVNVVMTEYIAAQHANEDVDMNENMIHKDDILVRAIECHLDYLQPHLSNWSSAASLLVDPHNLSMSSMQPAFGVVDDLCRFMDIRSSRLDWYSERGLLMFLYGTTEMFMLTDNSEDLAETKRFLRKNLETYNLLRDSPFSVMGLASVAMRMMKGGGDSSSSYSGSGGGGGSASRWQHGGGERYSDNQGESHHTNSSATATGADVKQSNSENMRV